MIRCVAYSCSTESYVFDKTQDPQFCFQWRSQVILEYFIAYIADGFTIPADLKVGLEVLL